MLVNFSIVSSCSLPSHVAKQLSELNSSENKSICIELKWENGSILFLLWTGRINNTDAIEVPSKMVEMAAHTNATDAIRNGATVEIRPIIPTRVALQVHLKPNSSVSRF